MTDELDVLSRLIDYHDHIAPPEAHVADDVRRGRRRVARNRGVAAGGVALAVAGVVVTTSLVTGNDPDRTPEPAPSPTPIPAPTKSQSPETWVDRRLPAEDGYTWMVLNPLDAVRSGWVHVVAEHLDPAGGNLEPQDNGTFAWPGVPYAHDGAIELLADRGPFTDGCAYLGTPPADSGIESCNTERLTTPAGEPARVSSYQRLCETWDPGSEGDDARPGPGSTYETCGDYKVAVAVERGDGLIGYLVVSGRGTTDDNPFTETAMVAAAADPHLTLPPGALDVPSNQAVADVVSDHFPDWRPDLEGSMGAERLGQANAGGTHGRDAVSVSVTLAGEDPTCGRLWLVRCVERRVFGADDPTTVFVGSWDEPYHPSCCPRKSHALSRLFAYVGPRHTVVLLIHRLTGDDESAIGNELDQRVIDFLLDPRLHQAGGR